MSAGLLFAVVLMTAAAGPSLAASESDSQASASSGPTLLGRSEQSLREEFGALLLAESLAPMRSTYVAVDASAVKGAVESNAASKTKSPGTPAAKTFEVKDPYAGQQRYVRYVNDHDIRRVDYELYLSHVYRVRWQLGEHFERPAMSSYVAQLTSEFGKPYYDQRIEAPFGSGRSTLRRAAWRSGDRNLELRQLNPMVGGPIFMTLTDLERVQKIVASGGTAAPEPETIGRWWNAPIEAQEIMTAAQRASLLAAFKAVWTQMGWKP